MAKAREVSGLHCDDPFGSVAAAVVRVRAAELVDHSEGVLDTGEIANLHAMRVATRRLRATMEVFEPCFPRKRFRAALREVKKLADALGERRDRDVSIGFLDRFGDAQPPAGRAGVEAMVRRLHAEQTSANGDLAPHIDRRRLLELRGRIEDLADAAERKAK